MGTAFTFFLIARVLIGVSSTMLSVAIGWHLYSASGNPFDLALVGLVQILPMLGLFIVSGWVVDRFSRKSILLLCAGAEIAVYSGLALSMADGEINRAAIFSLLFLHGGARAFYSPVLQAVLPNIVPGESLSRAVAMVSAAWTTADTIGPFAAGLAIAWLDFGVYGLLAVLNVLGAACFVFLPRLPGGQSMDRSIRTLLSGIRYVVANPIVMPSLSLDLLIIFFGSVVALLPIYAIDILQVGPEGLGLLRAMPALGGVMVGLLIAWLPPTRAAGRQLFQALAVFALSIVVFGLSTQLWLSMVALWVYGASDMISVNLRSTLIQLATPDALRGRVSAVNSLFISTSNELGDFRAGSVAGLLGPVPTVLLGGGLAAVVAVAGAATCSQLRQLDRLTDAQVARD
jgi:MFS family permease